MKMRAEEKGRAKIFFAKKATRQVSPSPSSPVCPLCPAAHGHTPDTHGFCSHKAVVLHTLPNRLHGREYTDVKYCSGRCPEDTPPHTPSLLTLLPASPLGNSCDIDCNVLDPVRV